MRCHTRIHSHVSPAEHFASRARSVDGYPLPIDELKGTKPTEKIDLTNKRLYEGSAIIIASCIKGNESLKELMCAAFPPRFLANMSAPDEHLRFPRSLDNNYLTGPRGNDMSGVIKLAEMLPQSKLQSLR